MFLFRKKVRSADATLRRKNVSNIINTEQNHDVCSKVGDFKKSEISVNSNDHINEDDNTSCFLEFIECNELPIELFDDTTNSSSHSKLQINQINVKNKESDSNTNQNNNVSVEKEITQLKIRSTQLKSKQFRENTIKPVQKENEYGCPLCEFVYSSKKSAQNHIDVKHFNKKTPKRKQLCSVCGQSFTNYASYNDHYKKHFPELLFKCQFCNKQYTTNYHCRQHEKMHTNDKQFMCELCDYSCIRRGQLKVNNLIFF